MARSLPLAAYLALRGSEDHARPTDPFRPRPKGTVVWAFCDDKAMLLKTAILGSALRAQGDTISVVATLPDADQSALKAPIGRRDIRKFLAHWSPQLVIWMGAPLDPLVIDEIAQAKIPLMMLEASQAVSAAADRHWIPGLTRAVLAKFKSMIAVDHKARNALVQAGAAAARVKVIGTIEETSPLLPYHEAERRELAELLGTRPVWLAADVGLDEVETLVTAHHQAARRSHRLLLIAACRAPNQCSEMAATLRMRGFDVAERAQETEPGDATQIYLVDGGEELGLWYRLAPMSYLGGTLAHGPCRHPYEAAALGSAVLHGPIVAPYEAQISRLSAAGACLGVRSGDELGDAVESLLAADKTASLAHAAWDVTTTGADVVNQLADMIHLQLDTAGP